MGNDGGTIAKGQDLRAIYSGGDVTSHKLDDSDKARLNTCTLSSLPFYENGALEAVVSDYKGQLYLKEKVVELLLAKRLGEQPKLPHISSLDDVVELKIVWSKEGHMTCPVTSVSKTSQSRFCYLRTCGCVVGAKILDELRKHYKVSEDEVDGKQSECPLCGKEFVFNYDVVVVYPQGADQESFNTRNYTFLTGSLNLNHNKKKRRTKKRKRDHKETVKRAKVAT